MRPGRITDADPRTFRDARGSADTRCMRPAIRLGGCVLAVSLVCLMATTPVFAKGTTLEVERMSHQGGGKVLQDRSASGGALRAFRRNGTSSRMVRVPKRAWIVVRVRGRSCKGSPRLRVQIGRRILLHRNVTNRRWRDYAVRSRAHAEGRLRLSSTRQGWSRRCSRRLDLDRVRVVPPVRGPVPKVPPRRDPLTPPVEPVVGIAGTLRWRAGQNLEDTVVRLRRAGAQFSREDFSWSRVESAPGRYDWSHLDEMMGASARNGLRIVAIPNNPPKWVSASDRDHTPPLAGDARAAYIRFVRAAIGRYGTNGTFWGEHPDLPHLPIVHWDMWNEPYISLFWAPSPNAGAYARFFRDVVSQSESVDPAARFMLETDSQTEWVDQMFAAVPDLARYADLVSVHPYTGDTPPEACGASVQERRGHLCRLLDVRAALDRHGAERAPMWITEVGYSTAPQGRKTVSEDAEARHVHTIFNLLRKWDVVEGMIWYTYQTSEQNPAEREDFFGLVRSDGSPKPAWDAFAEEAPLGL